VRHDFFSQRACRNSILKFYMKKSCFSHIKSKKSVKILITLLYATQYKYIIENITILAENSYVYRKQLELFADKDFKPAL